MILSRQRANRIPLWSVGLANSVCEPECTRKSKAIIQAAICNLKLPILMMAAMLLTTPPGAFAQEAPAKDKPDAFAKPSANRPDEPLAEKLSLARSAEFLDGAAVAWAHQRKCASCHTSYPYLMARPMMDDAKAPALLQMRKFLEERVANWDNGGKGAGLPEGTEGVTEVVATAATLAFHDAQATGKLHVLTRQALDRMWTLQQKDGSWTWNQHRLPPQEYDDYYGAVYAALGVGHAPENYARSESAKEGLARLKECLRKNPPPNLHHKTWLLWASLKLEGLMTPPEREQTIKELLALQRPDGGWNLPSLGDWKRLNGTFNDKQAPSDGYATGLVLYVLRQGGVSATKDSIRRGVTWLQTNQRASGRWFTRSLNADRAHYNTNAGTAYAVMALKACETAEK
jgi:squalene-hopene/tetraprenyl-beta-curcumene cyclase